MHISEGILTGRSMAATLAGGALALAWGVSRLQAFTRARPERKPLLSMAGAFIFLISLMPLPAYMGTTTHPCGTPLAAILLGPGVTVVLAGLSLLLQAAFFSHGGFSSLGANTLNLGLVGGLTGWGAYHLGRRLGLGRLGAGLLAGLLGDMAVYAAAGLTLGLHLAYFVPEPKLDLAGYLKVIYAGYLPVQTPLAIGEGLLTGWALQTIGRQRPEVLEDLGVEKAGFARAAGLALLLALLPLAVGLRAEAPAPAATPAGYVGMDEKVNEAVAAAGGAPARPPYLDTESLGDLWNFILLGAGALAGFVLGRRWEHLFGKRGPGTRA